MTKHESPKPPAKTTEAADTKAEATKAEAPKTTPATAPAVVPAKKAAPRVSVRVLRVKGPEKGFRRAGHAFGLAQTDLVIEPADKAVLEVLGLKEITEAQALAIKREPMLVSLELTQEVELPIVEK